MSNKIKVAVLGLGVMGAHHARVLTSMPEVDLVATFDSDKSRRVSGAGTVCSHRELSRQDIDYCVVATSTVSHKEIAIDLIRQGIPILLEKPVAVCSTDAQLIENELQKFSGRCAVGMIERYNRTASEARSILMKGDLGNLVKIATKRVGPSPGRDMGVGVTLDLGIHDLDLIYWITGEQLVETAIQVVREVVSSRDDLALIQGRLKTGVLVQMEVSWISTVKERTLDLLFEAGSVHCDLMTGKISVTKQDVNPVEWTAAHNFLGSTTTKSLTYELKVVEPLVAQHRAICNAVQLNDWSALPNIAEGVQLLRMIEKILAMD